MLGERGQAMILVLLALPVFFSAALFVVDGSQGFVVKRQMQGAADAAALAAAADVKPALDASTCHVGDPCFIAARTAVAATAAQYATTNGATVSNPLPACDVSHPTNCYTWPYPAEGVAGARGSVEVRLQGTVSGFFSNVARIAPNLLKPSARAVAGAKGTSPHCVYTPPIPDPDSHLPDCADIPGTFVPGNGGVGFAKSSSCVFDNPTKSAIQYTGAGGDSIGALETNGGFTGSGSTGSVTIVSLSLGRLGDSDHGKSCYDDPNGAATIQNPPVGGPFAPKDWTVPLPTVPTPGNGCTSLSPGGLSQDPVTPGALAGHPPGVYCVTGSLNLSGLDLSAGYTFYAPDVSVTGGTYKCYQLCAGVPGATSDATLFYATSGGIKMTGNSPSLTGNIFAPNDEVSFGGGGVSGGSGFIESQTLRFAGNFASYHGTGGTGGRVVGGNIGQRVDALSGAKLSLGE